MEKTKNCPVSRWRRRKDARPSEILDAALELFCQKGYAATTLEQVAKAAGVSKGTLYLYYDNKEELFRSMVRELLVPHVEDFERQAGEFSGNSAELLRSMALGRHAQIDDCRGQQFSGTGEVLCRYRNRPCSQPGCRNIDPGNGTKRIQAMRRGNDRANTPFLAGVCGDLEKFTR